MNAKAWEPSSLEEGKVAKPMGPYSLSLSIQQKSSFKSLNISPLGDYDLRQGGSLDIGFELMPISRDPKCLWTTGKGSLWYSVISEILTCGSLNGFRGSVYPHMAIPPFLDRVIHIIRNRKNLLSYWFPVLCSEHYYGRQGQIGALGMSPSYVNWKQDCVLRGITDICVFI
jgi:hypothetical protein